MTPTQREAMEQALEAISQDNPLGRQGTIAKLQAALAEQQDPVSYNGWVLREVLFDNGEPVGHREPQQEPVAWVGLSEDDKLEILRTNGEAAVMYLTEAKLREKNAEQQSAKHGEPFKPDWVNYRQGLADGWEEGYEQGVADERTSEANIGIAGFSAKVNPARENPYKNTAPQPAKRVPLTDDEIDVLWAKQQTKPFKTHAEDRMAFARAVIAAYERKNGITGETQ